MQFALNNCFHCDGRVEIIMNGETGSGLETATIAQSEKTSQWASFFHSPLQSSLSLFFPLNPKI